MDGNSPLWYSSPDYARLLRPDELQEAEHGRAVASIAVEIGERLGLAADDCRRLWLAGILHDIGKLSLPAALISKPGPLDDSEWAQMRMHPELGAEMLCQIGAEEIAGWVRSHHERFDGRGYPDGLAGEEIPLGARILAVADAYDAMRTGRPYAPGKSEQHTREELTSRAGTQFDPQVVEILLDCASDYGRKEADHGVRFPVLAEHRG